MFWPNRSADGSAPLIAFQRVSGGSEKVAGVEVAVAHEFEQIPVDLIRAGFRDGVDGCAGVHSVLSRKGAGLHLEFLQRIRKRERQIQIIHYVVMIRAVEEVGVSVALPSRYRQRDGRIVADRIQG